MQKYNFAIYGCGMIANIHAGAIKSLEKANLLGAADVYLPSAETFAKKHGIQAFKDFDELLADDRVDVICICTPNGTHADLAIKALENGKNVITEKPMAITTDDCDRMIATVEKSKGKLMVISQLRMSKDVAKAREIVKSGALGKLVLCDLYMRYYRSEEYYKGSWRGTVSMDGGGALMNQGIHGVDMLQYIVGPIKNIKSIVKTLVHNIEVEDVAVSAVEYESGALGVIEATTAAYPGFDREIKIHGTKGHIHLRENRIESCVIDDVGQPCEKFVSKGMGRENTNIDISDHAEQISIFMRVLDGEDVEYVNSTEGRKAVEIITRIYADK